MPRHSREQSATGIYHVMLRGVNRQSIFEDDEDCIKRINQHELIEQVSSPMEMFEDPLEKEDEKTVLHHICDSEARDLLRKLCSDPNICVIQTFKRKERNYIIESALKHGLGVRQLARITGVSYGIIQRINEKVGRRTVP